MVDIETDCKGVRRGGVYFPEMRHVVLYFRKQTLPMRFNVSVLETKMRQQSKRKKRSMTHHERHRLCSNGKRFWKQNKDRSMSVLLVGYRQDGGLFVVREIELLSVGLHSQVEEAVLGICRGDASPVITPQLSPETRNIYGNECLKTSSRRRARQEG